MSSLIVTVDGPGGTGKSSVSRRVAALVDLPHLDTGAYYRAATLAALSAGALPEDAEAVWVVVAKLDFDQEDGVMFLEGHDVSEEIRSDAVTASVSVVSSHREVRALMVVAQRDWVARHGDRAVVEGRDIGSVVFPDAPLKIYLDATPRVRAERRAAQTGESVADVLADLNRRDSFDSAREVSPLTIPDGAIVIDTSSLEFEEVVQRIVALVRSKS